MTGYTLKNNIGDTCAFPTGFTIRQGQPVRVYSGSGTSTSTTLYWGRHEMSLVSHLHDGVYAVEVPLLLVTLPRPPDSGCTWTEELDASKRGVE